MDESGIPDSSHRATTVGGNLEGGPSGTNLPTVGSDNSRADCSKEGRADTILKQALQDIGIGKEGNNGAVTVDVEFQRQQQTVSTPSAASDLLERSARKRFRPTGSELVPFTFSDSVLPAESPRPAKRTFRLPEPVTPSGQAPNFMILTGNEIPFSGFAQHSGIDIPGSSGENSNVD